MLQNASNLSAVMDHPADACSNLCQVRLPFVPLLVEDDADESSAEPTDDFGAATKIDGLSPVQDLLE